MSIYTCACNLWIVRLVRLLFGQSFISHLFRVSKSSAVMPSIILKATEE